MKRTRPPRKSKAETTADYREKQAERGLCRECREPVKIKSNGKPGRLCLKHAAADAARKPKKNP